MRIGSGRDRELRPESPDGGIRSRSPRASRGDRRRISWPAIRITVVALLTFGFGAAAFPLRPADENVPEPTAPSIEILADRPGVSLTVTVSISLHAGARQVLTRKTSTGAIAYGLGQLRPDNNVLLNIATPTPLAHPVNLVIELSGFPPSVSGLDKLTLLHPVIPRGCSGCQRAAVPVGATPLHSYVLEEPMFEPASGPSLAALVLTSWYQAGAAVNTTQIRLSLPTVNSVSANLLKQLPSTLTSMPTAKWFPFVTVPRSAHLPGRLYQPAVQFTSESFSDLDVDTSNYEILSGNPPETGGGGWTWKNPNNVTVLAENVAEQASEQTRTFWSGVLLGIAGAGLLTLALEVIGAFQARAELSAATKPDAIGAASGGDAGPTT